MARLVTSKVFVPAWPDNRYYFPPPPGDETPEFITRRVQLPADVVPGDLIVVTGQEEFDNEGRWTTINPNFFGSGEIVRGPNVNGPWSVIRSGYGANWDARQHHWGWHQSVPFLASTSTPGSYVALRFWFARNVSLQDPLYDFVEVNPTYGWITAAIHG